MKRIKLKTTIKYCTLFFLMNLTSLTHAAPTAFQAQYAVQKSGMTLGTMQATLSYSGNTYTYQKSTKTNGLAALLSGDTLNERSQGSKQGVQLSSNQYLHHHKSKRKDKRDQFSFTTPTQVQGQYKDQAYQLQVPAGTVDPALLELHVMDDIATNRPLNYNVTERGKLKQYQFQKLGQETINVPAGQYQCEKVQVVRDGGKRQTVLWLAPALNYALVQVRHTDDGDVIQTQLQSYQAR